MLSCYKINVLLFKINTEVVSRKPVKKEAGKKKKKTAKKRKLN